MHQTKYLITKIKKRLILLLEGIRVKRSTGKIIASIMLPLLMVGYGVVGWLLMKKIISPVPAKESSIALQEKALNATSQEIPEQADIKNQEQILDYNPDTIKDWGKTLSDLRKIQPSWQKWNKDADYYKENKDDIQRINVVISQRIANCQKILISMKAGLQLTDNERKLINADKSLYNEQETLAKRINKNVEAWEPKSDISKKYSSTPDPIATSQPIVTPPPYVKKTTSPSAPIDTEAIRRQQEASCESNYTSCVSSGIAREESLLRARGMESSSEAQLVASRVTNSCKIQYKCEVYP